MNRGPARSAPAVVTWVAPKTPTRERRRDATASPAAPMPDTAARVARLDGHRVEYAVRRSDRASRARIDVGLRGVEVVLPAGSRRDPERLLRAHADWVVETDERLAARRAEVPERRFEAGATFPYLGEPHEVVVERRSAADVVDGELRLAAHHVERTSVERALECLYRRLARERFEALLDRHAPAAGVDDWRLEVRNQRTKWGSCSSSGTISLNWRLVLAPPAVSRYVVCHELVHRRVPHHGDAFWAALREIAPDCESQAAWLEANGHRLAFTEADL